MSRDVKNNRFIILIIVAVLIFFVFVYRLFQIQILNGEEYAQQRIQGITRKYKVDATRGQILDINKEPLVKNRTGYNVIFDYAYMPKSEQNDRILAMSKILSDNDEIWIDTLPITLNEPFEFLPDQENLLDKIKDKLKLQGYSNVEYVMNALIEEYKIPREYSNQEIRIIAGVRYEMDRRGFSLYNNEFTFAEDVSIETVIKINESVSLSGVRTVETPIREYVSGTIAPHILGQIGPIYAEDYETLDHDEYALNDFIGRGGLEEFQEKYLRGKKGWNLIELDSNGKPMTDEPEVLVPPEPGNTIVTTIDKNLQLVAQDSLQSNINRMRENARNHDTGKDSEAGAVVAIEVKTGKILAMATYPSYDINDYRTKYSELVADPLAPLFNRATQGAYAPGSCYKPVVATAGFMNGIVTEDYTVNCTHIYTFYNSYRPQCMGYHGHFNVVNALRKSCNIFFYDTGRMVGIDEMNKYANLYGLGVKTNIGISETSGQVANEDSAKVAGQDWFAADVIQAAIGQSYNQFSVLQMANYAATIARDGELLQPTLIDSIISYNGDKVIKKFEPVTISKITGGPEDMFPLIKEGMRLASTYQGTSGGTFGNYPITVASKTGSPQRNDNMLNSAYICFAPLEDPEIAIMVLIEKGGQGSTAAPVARDIMNEYFGFNKK